MLEQTTSEQRFVVDTNVLISRLLLPHGVAAQALDLALSRGVLLASDATLTELVEVLSRPKFDPYITQEERKEFIRKLGGIARVVDIAWQDTVCRDPKDDKFLHVAVNGEATVLLTGDKDLLVLHPFHGVEILSPSIFLQTNSQENDNL